MSITIRRNMRRRCPACTTFLNAGDELQYNRHGQLVHTTCDADYYEQVFDPSPSSVDRGDDNQPAYIVTGGRDTEPLCSACHLYHAGECF